jgi:hypothetical protein
VIFSITSLTVKLVAMIQNSVARELAHYSLCPVSSGFGHGSVLHLGFAQAS